MKAPLKTALFKVFLIGLILVNGFEANGAAQPLRQDFGGLSRTAQDRPNAVLILSDDMGYSDLPKFGTSEISTPNIDRLANEGTLFTDAYVTAPVCVVSRMGLLTGQYQQRFGMYDNIYGEDKVGLFLDQTLLPQVFQKAGYRTALVGKWYLNGNKREQYSRGNPLQRGFDEYISFLGVDLLPFVQGKNESKPHEWLCWQNRSWLPKNEGGFVVPTPKVHNSAIRKGNWKLVRYNEKLESDNRPPDWRLYNLATDIGERNDVSDKHGAVVKELSSLFDAWRASMHPTIE